MAPVIHKTTHVTHLRYQALDAEYLADVNIIRGFPGGSVVNNPPANAGDTRDLGSIPGSGRFPGVGHGNPL